MGLLLAFMFGSVSTEYTGMSEVDYFENFDKFDLISEKGGNIMNVSF